MKRTHPTRQRPTVLAVALAICFAGCAGYQVGQQALYRPDVRTVHVPIFDSHSFRRNLAERLTEAVATEIQIKTPYRVVGPERAESVLRGRIINEEKKVIGEDKFDIPRVIETPMTVEVDWVGSSGQLLAHTLTVPVDRYQLRVMEAEQFIPEAGQSVVTAQQKVIEELAEQIVSQMEILPW